MSNMSYCRFQNTVLDLIDCMENDEGHGDNLSYEENKARERLIETMIEYLENLGCNVDCEASENY